jgi:hypothetical protein
MKTLPLQRYLMGDTIQGFNYITPPCRCKLFRLPYKPSSAAALQVRSQLRDLKTPCTFLIHTEGHGRRQAKIIFLVKQKDVYETVYL